MDRLVAGTTRVIGVFGHPVRHSLSPAMHNAAFAELGLDYAYVPFDVHPDNLETAIGGIRALGIIGVNVTIPHKEQVIRYLDWVSDEALRIGSVNTIHNLDGKLMGYSTDGYGFIKSLEAAGGSPDSAVTVVLGAGGSARAIAYALAERGAKLSIVNRTYRRAADLACAINSAFGEGCAEALATDDAQVPERICRAELLVNCTSVGMYPHTDEMPILPEWLHRDLFVYDQIYNPLETRLLKAARAIGAHTENGVGMLVHQGAQSFRIWTGQSPPTASMTERIIAELT